MKKGKDTAVVWMERWQGLVGSYAPVVTHPTPAPASAFAVCQAPKVASQVTLSDPRGLCISLLPFYKGNS